MRTTAKTGAVLRWGRGNSPNLSIVPPKSLVTATACSSKTNKTASYTGGVFWRVGVVDLIDLACVLRATTKKSSTFLPFS